MDNKKGQALVEFVAIIPVFFVIIFSAIDLGNVIYKKYHLENDLDYIVELYRQNKTDEMTDYAQKKEFKIGITTNEDIVTVKLEKSVSINTPGVNLVMGNPYQITVDRVIYNEE